MVAPSLLYRSGQDFQIGAEIGRDGFIPSLSLSTVNIFVGG
ncbi:hypothetical protein [Gloeothece verrucosa]|nr:hypothetical protein [Gloeothece verrucosa]